MKLKEIVKNGKVEFNMVTSAYCMKCCKANEVCKHYQYYIDDSFGDAKLWVECSICKVVRQLGEQKKKIHE